MLNGRKTYDDYFKDRDKKNGNVQNKPDPTSTMFRRNTSGIVGINTDYGNSVYDENLNWGADINNDDVQGSLNEFRANEQSALDHLGIGATRTVAKATTEVLKLPGVIGGIGIMAADGLTGGNLVAENEGFETAFNNQWIKFFDGLNEDVKEAMPVYVKESVTNGDFFTKIGSSATWATEGADGLGYMVGALAPGGLFKYFGGAAKIFGTSAKVAKLSSFGKSMEAGRKALKAVGITTKNIDQYMIPAFNTFAEAGAESKGVWDGMESRKDEAHAEYMSKLNPNDPRYQTVISLRNEEIDQLRRIGEISLEESQELYRTAHITAAETMFEKDFKEQKALAAQNTFFKNAVVLAGPNYIQAKILFGKTPSKVLLDKIGGLGEKTIKNTVKQGVKNFAKGFASEGAEEVGQTAIEHRNIEEGLKFNLGNDRGNDYNLLTFGDDFIKTLGTTEGQMAGFLGGIMGGPMSAVGSYFQDKSDRVQTERLREKINGASTAYADIKNTNIYEQEEYINPETGEVDFRDKEVDGKKVFIPENVAKVKNALNLIEKDSNDYDNAVEDGNVEKIEQFRNRGEFNVIANFIGEDEVTLDALHEHLKVAFPTETSKDISDEQVKINKINLERIDKIMSKAKHLQKDFVSFKDMSTSILRINHPNITKESTKEEKEAAKEHLEDFLNRVGNTFLSERAEEYEAKQTLNKLEKQKLELENNSTVVEIDNLNYIEGISSELDKKTKTRSNNPRLELVNGLIDKVKEQLKSYEENTNSNIWNNELLNKQFAEEVEERKQIQTENSPEQVAQNDAVITAAKNATTEEEVTDIEKNAPPEVIANPVIKNQINSVKEALAKAKRRETEEQIADATQEDNDFNDTTVYSDLNGTEGSPVTDELIPTNSENNTAQEVKEVENGNETVGKGAQVISTYRRDDEKGRWKAGDAIDFIKEKFSNFLKYEKEPVDKTGRPVTFEINTNPGSSVKINEALTLYNTLTKRGFTTMTDAEYNLLYDYLPINARFKPDVNAPILTKYRIKDVKTDEWIDKMDTSTGNLRTQLINNLRNGIVIEDMSTTIQGQYKGFLKVDDNRLANNNILELDGVPNLKYVRDNLYVVDSFGNLKNIQNGKIVKFANDKVKSNAKGEIYLMIPQANGLEFPLKLNIKKINNNEAVLLYYIYKEILTNDKALNTTVSQVNDELKALIKNTFKAELGIIGGNENDIKLQTIIDLLIYQSDNVKSRMQIDKDADGNNILLYSNGQDGKIATRETIEEDMGAIIDYLENSKRHQIKIGPKFATDNTKTNLQSNNADYLKYLIDNNILSTNAVVGKDKDGNNIPTFQGYTNIYLNTGVTVNNQYTEKTTTIQEFIPVTDFDLKKGDILYNLDSNNKIEETFSVKAFSVGGEGMKQYLKGVLLINNETKNEKWWNYNDRFTWNDLFKKSENNQPKISEAGVEADNNDFGDLDFNDKQNVVQPVIGLQITYTPTGKQTQTYSVNKNKIFNSKGEEVFKIDSADRRKIFANVAVKEGRAKVIENSKGVKYVVNDKLQIMSTATGKIMEWDENHGDRKFLIGVYESLKQPKVSEQGVQISADDMGLDDDSFETEPKVENKVLDKIKSFAENNIESQKEILGLQNVKSLYEPRQGNPNFTIIIKGDIFDILTFFEKGQWSIFPKQPNGEFQASDPKTGNALILSPEKRKEVVIKYVPKELIKLLEDADKVKGLQEQDKFMEGDIKKYLYLYEKENLKLQLDYAENNLKIFESPNYQNKDSQERIIEAQKESIKILKEKLKALENKSETTRNSQENFVSLSEIPGTMENTELNKTQAEVFKDNKSPSERLKDAARMAPIIQKYKESLQEGGQPLSARDQVKLNKWAEENPDAYKKIC